MQWLYTQERLRKAGAEGMTPELGLKFSQEDKTGKKGILDRE